MAWPMSGLTSKHVDNPTRHQFQQEAKNKRLAECFKQWGKYAVCRTSIGIFYLYKQFQNGLQLKNRKEKKNLDDRTERSCLTWHKVWSGQPSSAATWLHRLTFSITLTLISWLCLKTILCIYVWIVTWQVDGDGSAGQLGQMFQGSDAEPVFRGETDAVKKQNWHPGPPAGWLTLSVEQWGFAAVHLHGPRGHLHVRHAAERRRGGR